MKISLGYGHGEVSLHLPEGFVRAVLAPHAPPAGLTGADEVRRALQNPIGTPRLRDLAVGHRRVAIVTSDITRPVPSYLILPEILSELSAAGVPDTNITVVFALGSHRAHTEADRQKLAGDAVFQRVRCVDSDPADCVRMGVTARGTPVDVTREAAEADLRVCVGNIEYHYFAGYSGGAKAIMPGVSTREAIRSNHSHMVEPGAATGMIAGNPVREDIDEVLDYCPIDFIANVVLDEHKRIIHCACGHPIAAHREGCRYLDAMYKLALDRPADLVIASAGGYPKDINLYQAQKALDNAARAVRPGGIIVLTAECAEGMGEDTFSRWMRTLQPEQMIDEIRRDFVLGGHKAAAIALTLRRARVFLVSAFPPDAVRAMGMVPFGSAEAAVCAAMNDLGDRVRAIAMPWAGSTLPYVTTEDDAHG